MKPFMSAALLAVVAAASCQTASATAIAATYSSASAGSLNGTAFTITGAGSLGSTNLSGSSYSAAPLSASQRIVNYPAANTLTITFASPVSDLLFYDVFFRGAAPSSPTPTYNFGTPISILSGNQGASIVGGTALQVTNSGFYSGILSIPGPLTTLQISATGSGASQQAFTMGVQPAAVPEPATLGLWSVAGLAAAGFAAFRRRRAA